MSLISSVHGLRGSPYKSAYVAAKHGLEGLSKVTALEGGPRGVTSNCVNPSYVRTPLVQKQVADQARIHGIAEDEVVEKVMLTEPGDQAADRTRRGRRPRGLARRALRRPCQRRVAVDRRRLDGALKDD